MTSHVALVWLPVEAGGWLQLLVEMAIKSLIILLFARAVVGILKSASASTRHLVLSLTVSALIMLPALISLLPGVRFPILPTLMNRATADATFTGAVSSQPEISDPTLAPPIDATISSDVAIDASINNATKPSSIAKEDGWAAAQALPPVALIPEAGSLNETAAPPVGAFDWAKWLLAIWLVGVLVVLGRFLTGFIKVWLIARDSRPVTEISWVMLTISLANRIGLQKSVKVLRSERVVLPMTWGALRSVILLPAASDDWSLKCRSIVLLHELAHIKRRDCLTQTLAQLACAFYWFNPMVWAVASRLRVEREMACDDEVLQAGTRASDYAGYLVDIARSFGANVCVSPFAVGMACSELENRVRTILNPDVKRRTTSRFKGALSGALAATFIIPLATIQPWVIASTRDEKLLQSADRCAANAGEVNHERELSENTAANDREILRSIDVIKASLQTSEAASQPTTIDHRNSETVIAHELLQPAALIEGQGVGAGQGVGEGQAQGSGGGVGSGQGSGSGSGRGEGSGAGLGSAQAEKQAKELTADEMIKLKMFSVTPEYTEAVRKMGFENVTVDQIIHLKTYKVDEDYVRQVRSWGFDKVTIREVLNLKMAGVTGDYVAAMKSAGFELSSVRQLASMKMLKLTPEYIDTLRRAGYDKLSLNQLMSLRSQNIDDAFIRQAESWNGGKLTINQLLQIKIHQVTPAFASEIKAMGFDNVPLGKLIELKIHGINSDYVREMRNLGFENVSLNQLIEMKMHGIDEILLKNSK